MKMAESIVCLRLWHDRFSPRYRKVAPTFRWQPLHIVAPKCKVLCYQQQDQFLDLLTNITHRPQNLLTFSNAQIPTTLHAFETFRAVLPYPAYVKTQKMTEANSKKRNENAPEATKHQTFGPQSSELSTQNIGTLSPRSPMFLNSQLEKPAQST